MRRDHALLSTALLALSPLTGCNRQPAATATSAAAPAGLPVQVIRPQMRAVKRVVGQPGAVQAFEETALLAKIPGYVRALADDPAKADRPPHDRRIDIGSRVKKDQVLAELAIPELDAEWQRKQALVRQAEAEVVQSDKSVLAARAAVAAAGEAVAEAEAGVARAQALYDRWQSEATRITKLVKGGVIDDQSRDEIQNQFRAAGATRSEATAHVAAARAAVKKAEADRDKAAADVVAAKARQEVARAAVAEVDARRGYAKIRAPFDGVVTHRAVNTGDLVSPAEKRPLFRVARIDPVRVVVRVPEADAGLVADGQAVLVALQAVPGPAARGTVTRSSWSLEPGSRTLRTEIDLPNPQGRLRPGMYVTAELTAELPAAWAVPAAAVGQAGGEPIIYLVENGKAVRASVQLLRGDGQFTQLRRYKRPGAGEWTDVTGAEAIASPAAALTDGRPVAGIAQHAASDSPVAPSQTVALGGIPNKTQSNDKGIDGRVYPVDAITPELYQKPGELDFMDYWYPVQVKQKDKAGRPDIDSFEAVMMREKRAKGFFVAFDFTAGALREIDAFFRREHRAIIPLTVREILEEEIARKLV